MWTKKDFFKIGNLDIKDFDLKVKSHDWHTAQLERIYPLKGSTVIYYEHFSSVDLPSYKRQLSFKDKFLREESKFILNKIQDIFPNYRFVKGEISCCPSNEVQVVHRDPRVFHSFSKRLHVALTTNNKCYLNVEDNYQHFKQGEIWEFNNIKIHGALNKGSTDRHHIILDLMSNNTWNFFNYYWNEEEIYDGIGHLVIQRPLLLIKILKNNKELILPKLTNTISNIVEKIPILGFKLSDEEIPSYLKY